MKYIVNIIALIALVFIIYGAVRFKETGRYETIRSRASRVVGLVKQKTGIVKDNIALELGGERKKPTTSLVKKETRLIALSPETFQDFNYNDWQEFWSIIYDPIREEGGLFAPKRYRTKEEIKGYLLDRYSGFSRFRTGHWRFFWDIVFE